MNTTLLLNYIEHSKMGWKPPVGYKFAAAYNMVRVGLPELPMLLPIYPLGIFRPAPAAPLQLMALTGFRPGTNLFVEPGGRWTAPYIPRSMYLYPFVLQLGQGAKFSVGFIQDSDAWRDKPDTQQGEHRFFDDAGQQSVALAQIVQGLQVDLKAQQLTLRAMQALESHDLLEPWPGAHPQGDASIGVDPAVGLFRVSEDRLNALDAQALKGLQQAHALPLAYAQLLSLGRMEVLRQLTALYERNALKEKELKPQQAPLPDLRLVEEFFETRQADTIKFNW